MPISSPRTAFPTGFPADTLDRRIAAARGVLAVERILPRLWPAAAFAGFYLALALTGIFPFIPWPVQALLLAATITAIGLSLAEGFADFRWPRGIDGARRLERDNHLAHRPISERHDRLAGGDGFARQLWALHQARTLPAKFRIALPQADIAARDPHGLRWYLVIALAAGLIWARGDTWPRLVAAFDSGAGAAATLDAWIDPPPYTGLPLQSLRMGDGNTIAVPQGSVLNLRVHGAPRRPGLAAGSNDAPRFAGEEGEYSSNVIVSSSARVRVQVGGRAIGQWHIEAVPDMRPSIELTATPRRTEQLATRFAFKGGDDYGIASLRAVILPEGKPAAKPLRAELPFAAPNARKVEQEAFVDLTSHPYAGMMVQAHLEARDAIGQTGTSRTVHFRLPARVFTDPLARALIEQRQVLATAQKGRENIMTALDALSIEPERFYEGQHDIYLAIRNAFYGVRNARTEADIERVQRLLWDTALKLERGGLLSAAEELRKLQAMLTAAMASGAPQEVIEELLKRYDQAMQRYLQAMAANPPPPGQEPLSPDAKTLGMNDIQTLMQMIQKLTEAGEREQAAQLLAMLQSMLENLRLTQGGGAGGMGQQSPQDKKRNEQIQKFGGLMNKQRDLMDRTFRQGQGQGSPKDGGPQGLARQQGELQRELGEAMKGMDPKAQQKMREAGQAMGQAQGALGQNDLPNAGNAQNQALEAMRQGAEALARQDQQGQQQGRADPLGRGPSPFGNSGVKIPGPTDLARAREILQELRRRAAEMGRPQAERDYLDRLLKAF